MFPLSTSNHWRFTKHTSWPSKPQLPKFPQKDSWGLWAKDEMTYLEFCCHFVRIWFLLEKRLSMNMREEIWAVSIQYLSPIHMLMLMLMMLWDYDPNWWRGNVDHESATWSKDLVGYVSPIHVVEWDMSLFWALKRFTKTINNMLMSHGLPMK